MPESVPGPNSFRATSGYPSFTWLQLLSLEPGCQSVFSWSTVRHVAQSFSLLTMTVSASFATWNSTYSTPLSSQIFASSSVIGREASLMSVSPRQKRSKPPPVPEIPTVMRTSEFSRWKFSAAAVTYGPTVLEPSAVIVPPLEPPPPHPATVATSAASAIASRARPRLDPIVGTTAVSPRRSGRSGKRMVTVW